MSTAARLVDVVVPESPAGVVIVLHGGASRRGGARVSPAQLSVLRMIPVASSIRHAGAGRLAVVRLLNSRRGWDTEYTPVQDVEWALEETAARFSQQLPVCLVGHSLGGRAALLSAGKPGVRGVVALAPWVEPADVLSAPRDVPVVIIHGDADQVASPDRSRALARRRRSVGDVAYVTVAGGTHAMLRRREAFDTLAARCAVWMLLGEVIGQTVGRIAAHEPCIEV